MTSTATMNESILGDGRILPSASIDHGDATGRPRSDSEGVEVVLDSSNAGDVGNDASRMPQDQNVFRPPRPVRPRAMRPHGASPAMPPHVPHSGSFGYSDRHHPDYANGAHRPYPVPYNPSGSFDEGYHPQSHYSPNVQYPNPTAHADGINVISPNHKTGASSNSPPRGPHSYHYPPASPVSRPDATVPPPSASSSSSSPPRLRRYAMASQRGPYSAAQRPGRPDDHPPPPPHHRYSGPPPPPGARGAPPTVGESFDSEHYASHHSYASHPATPDAPHYGARRPDYPPRYHGGSFGTGSFDSHGPPPPPSHYEEYRYPGYSPHHPPESPYTRYPPYSGYSPGGYYDSYSSPYPEYSQSMSQGMHGYDDNVHHGYGKAVSPEKNNNGMLLPAAAQEIDFNVTEPPMEPVTPPSTVPICDSAADVNAYDVLLGRGGGTNSQIGNRRFRKLVQEFQPTYLIARRKEKPLLARTIVLIIRKRGGRFLKKDDDTGRLFEVGDAKAEAKTSQALREGLDVRATRSAANTSSSKKKKKSKKDDGEDDAEPNTPAGEPKSTTSPMSDEDETPKSANQEKDADGENGTSSNAASSPPIIPKLQGEKPEDRQAPPRPGSPESMHFRKRRRMRSGDGTRTFMGNLQDKLFSEFCPPRADLARGSSPANDDSSVVEPSTGYHSHGRVRYEDEDPRYQSGGCNTAGGCAGIALDMAGAAAGSFFLGPKKW